MGGQFFIMGGVAGALMGIGLSGVITVGINELLFGGARGPARPFINDEAAYGIVLPSAAANHQIDRFDKQEEGLCSMA